MEKNRIEGWRPSPRFAATHWANAQRGELGFTCYASACWFYVRINEGYGLPVPVYPVGPWRLKPLVEDDPRKN